MSHQQRPDYRFAHRLRVRWVEVDMQKIVFNGHYSMYFDTAMADYWRELALPYEESMASLDGDLYVKRLVLEYHASARYDDVLDVGLKCMRIGKSSIQFEGGIFRGDQLLVSGELLYVFADPRSQTSQPVPAALREILMGHTDGRELVSLKSGNWATLGQDAAKIRTEVFMQEQAIAPELEWDEADQTALHLVAYNGLGAAIATARLLTHAPGVARIGRVAVRRQLRGSGLGAKVMHHLLDLARQRGDSEVTLSAQCSALGFYERQGYRPYGEVFDDAGIAHREMRRAL
jgi:YbgC/YbaW family acyl-CoA thioester hydrolase